MTLTADADNRLVERTYTIGYVDRPTHDGRIIARPVAEEPIDTGRTIPIRWQPNELMNDIVDAATTIFGSDTIVGIGRNVRLRGMDEIVADVRVIPVAADRIDQGLYRFTPSLSDYESTTDDDGFVVLRHLIVTGLFMSPEDTWPWKRSARST